jgi:hypothetical protein
MGKDVAAPVAGGEVEEASWRLGSHVPEPVGCGGCCWLKEEDARLGRCWATRPGVPSSSLGWCGKERRERWVGCITDWAQCWKGIGIRILIFWWLVWMDSKGYLNLNENIWTVSKIEIWKMIQGFISNEFELKVWNISKFDSKT